MTNAENRNNLFSILDGIKGLIEQDNLNTLARKGFDMIGDELSSDNMESYSLEETQRLTSLQRFFYSIIKENK